MLPFHVFFSNIHPANKKFIGSLLCPYISEFDFSSSSATVQFLPFQNVVQIKIPKGDLVTFILMVPFEFIQTLTLPVY